MAGARSSPKTHHRLFCTQVYGSHWEMLNFTNLAKAAAASKKPK
jgi:hypothetical protein